jgi:RHS repeat-associated protein
MNLSHLICRPVNIAYLGRFLGLMLLAGMLSAVDLGIDLYLYSATPTFGYYSPTDFYHGYPFTADVTYPDGSKKRFNFNTGVDSSATYGVYRITYHFTPPTGFLAVGAISGWSTYSLQDGSFSGAFIPNNWNVLGTPGISPEVEYSFTIARNTASGTIALPYPPPPPPFRDRLRDFFPTDPGAKSCGTSIVENDTQAHIHSVVDYQISPQDPLSSGCSTCSGAGPRPSETEMPRFHLERIHCYQDIDRHGSFGPGVFSNYDVQMQVGNVPFVNDAEGRQIPINAPSFYVWDPVSRTGSQIIPNYALFFNNLNNYSNISWDSPGHQVQSLRITDAVGNVYVPGTTKVLSYSVSSVYQGVTSIQEVDVYAPLFDLTNKSVEITWADGTVEVFQLIAPHGTSSPTHGRLAATKDPIGHRTNLTYIYSPSTPLASMGNDPMQLWSLASIVDPYGAQATFDYGYADGQPVISAAHVPNATTITYGYDTSGLIGLNHVVLPDGATGSFTAQPVTYDNPNMQQVVYDDPAAEGVHRRKTVTYTPMLVASSVDGSAVPQVPNLTMQVNNNSQETVYAAWYKPSNSIINGMTISGFQYLFEGGVGSIYIDRVQGVVSVSNGRIIRRAMQGTEVVQVDVLSGYDAGIEDVISQPPLGILTHDSGHRLTASMVSATDGFQYTRDDAGRILQTTELKGGQSTVESTVWTAGGEPASKVDRAQRVTTMTYAPSNPHLKMSEVRGDGTPESATWQWTYTALGLVQQKQDPLNRVTDYAYASNGALISVTDPPDVVGGPRAAHTYAYDVAGRLTDTSYAGTRAVHYEYDERNRLTAVRYADGTAELRVYGRQGHDVNLLISKTDRAGNVTTFGYDDSGRCSSEITVNGSNGSIARHVSRTFVAGTQLVSREQENANLSYFTYDENRRVTKVVHLRSALDNDSFGLNEYTSYDSMGNVARRIAANGCATIQINGPMGLPARIVTERVPLSALPPFDRVGGKNPPYTVQDFTYDGEGNILTETDPNGIVTTKTYDGQGRLQSQVVADGLPEAQRTVFEHDAVGNVTTTWHPRSFVYSGSAFTVATVPRKTVVTYSGRNLPLTRTEAVGTPDAATTNYTYTLTGQIATVSDPRNPAWLTQYAYTPCCDRLSTITDPYGNQRTMGYDPNGNPASVIDADGVGFYKTFDAVGRVLTQTNTAGETRTYAYESEYGSPLYLRLSNLLPQGYAYMGFVSEAMITEPSGATSYVVTDVKGRPLLSLDPLRRLTLMQYGDERLTNQTILTILPNHQQTLVVVDGEGRALTQTAIDGNSSSKAYDAVGNLVSTRDANGVGTDYQVDGIGRVSTQIDTSGARVSYGYDAENNRITQTDALGHSATSAFTYRNQLQTSTDRNGKSTSYSYDVAGNLTSLVDAEGKQTSYFYDNRNLRIGESYPAPTGGSITSTYTPGGRSLVRTDQAHAITLAYDLAGRVKQRSYSTGSSDTFTYDLNGQLTQAVSGLYGNTIKRTYDMGGQLKSETLTEGTESWALTVTRDILGRPVQQQLPDGTNEAWAYGVNGLPGLVALDGQVLVSNTYDPGMRRIGSLLGNGIKESWGWATGDNLVQSVSAPGVFSQGYTYDKRKVLTAMNDGVAANSQSRTYDMAERVTTWQRGSTTPETESWTLSPVGDWTSVKINGVAQARTHSNVHEVTSVAGLPLTYDTRGNLTRDDAGRIFAWDVNNHLASATVAGAVTTYKYDALGRRVERNVGTLRTVWTLMGDQEQWSETLDPVARAAWKAPTAPMPAWSQNPLPDGAIMDLQGTVRVNFQPSTSTTPAGWLPDTGLAYQAQNGATYGWNGDQSSLTVDRDWLGWPTYDTFVHVRPDASTDGTWQYALPNGTYPVIVVCGDAHSRQQTNHLVVNGQPVRDPTPYDGSPTAGYELGSFDGYALSVTVTGGNLTMKGAADSLDPKLCFLEIGPQGGTVDAATQARLTDFITKANAQTATGRPDNVKPLRVTPIHGLYVDDRIAEKTHHGTGPYAVNKTRYLHSDRQFSIVATTDETGVVTERYRYDPYGKRTVLAPDAVTVRTAAIEDGETSFTGRDYDAVLGLQYYRNRWYSPALGRFVNRDPAGYIDGASLYAGYFSCKGLDPFGLYDEAGHFYTTYLVAIAAGMLPEQAYEIALYSQYPDEDGNYDAMRAPAENRTAVQEYLHSLTGGDPVKLRKYLGCLIKNGGLSNVELGIVIHALGDAYAHAFPHFKRIPGRENDKGNRWGGKDGGNMTSDGERLYSPGLGHFFQGHMPDYIASDPAKYGNYVDQLYELLSGLSDGMDANPDMIDSIKALANGLPQPGIGDFFFDATQNQIESDALRNLPGGYNDEYHPEWLDTPKDGTVQNDAFMSGLMDKIKNGIKECCPGQ